MKLIKLSNGKIEISCIDEITAKEFIKKNPQYYIVDSKQKEEKKMNKYISSEEFIKSVKDLYKSMGLYENEDYKKRFYIIEKEIRVLNLLKKILFPENAKSTCYMFDLDAIVGIDELEDVINVFELDEQEYLKEQLKNVDRYD